MLRRILWSTFILIVLCHQSEVRAQIVLHEISSDGRIEILNLNTNMIDLTDWWLVNTPIQQRLSTFQIECGSLMIEAFDIVVIQAPTFFSTSSGELALFSTNSFGNADALVDYVIWGNRSGNTLESIAVEGGHWPEGERAPGFASGQSLQFDRNGNSADNWSVAEQTLCEEVNPCLAMGGEISFIGMPDTVQICSGDGVPDPLDIVVAGDFSDDRFWVITDTDSLILGIQSSLPIDLESAPAGSCLVWHLSVVGRIDSLAVGKRMDELLGCFQFSNPLLINRSEVNGGVLATGEGGDELFVCIGDGIEDEIGLNRSDVIGENTAWIIADTSGMILDLPPGPPFNVEGAGDRIWQIWSLSYAGNIVGLQVGARLDTLQVECAHFSNPISIIRNQGTQVSEGGTITLPDSTTQRLICSNDGESDAFDVLLEGESGINSGWVITDTTGTILAVPEAPPFDLEGTPSGICLLWHISYDEGLEGLVEGGHVSDLTGGCFDFSNAITIQREAVLGGILMTIDSLDQIAICAGDGNPDPFDVMVSGHTGSDSTGLFTTEDSLLIVVSAGPPFDLDRAGPGRCLVWHVSHLGPIPLLSAGAHINELSGCYGLSNPILVDRSGVDGGILLTQDSTERISICAGDGNSDAFTLLQSDTTGPVATWVITDTAGLVLALPDGPSFNLDGAGPGICEIWHVRSLEELESIALGGNIENLRGCLSISNPITVQRDTIGQVCETVSTRDHVRLELLLYPNPVTEWLTIENPGFNQAKVQVTDLRGRNHLTRVLMSDTIKLPVGHLPRGLYQVRVSGREGVALHSFVKI